MIGAIAERYMDIRYKVPVAVVGVVVLLCLLVGCCVLPVLVARSFAALTSRVELRVELLEAGSGAAVAWEGGRSCLKYEVGFFV